MDLFKGSQTQSSKIVKHDFRSLADGKFVVWRGVSDETIAEMQERLPHISKMKSSARYMDMLPSTDKEKSDARKAELQEKQYLDEMARRAERGEDITLPPRTKEVPLSR